MRITRDDVLKAIEEEPLWPGHWVEPGRYDSECTVCAVGAVLRQKGLINHVIRLDAHVITAGVYSSADNIKRALSNQNYMGALSIKFERLCEEGALLDTGPMRKFIQSDVKPKLREWVLETLPDGVLYNSY